MLRAAHIIAALVTMTLSPAALAQKSSGHMDLDDLSSVLGVRLGVFRVMFSATDAICPQQTGLFRIRPNGMMTDIVAIIKGPNPGYRMDPTPGPDDFTFRRRMEAESCRIDIDIGEQQQRNGEWVPLVSLLAGGREAVLKESVRPREKDDPPRSRPLKEKRWIATIWRARISAACVRD